MIIYLYIASGLFFSLSFFIFILYTFIFSSFLLLSVHIFLTNYYISCKLPLFIYFLTFLYAVFLHCPTQYGVLTTVFINAYPFPFIITRCVGLGLYYCLLSVPELHVCMLPVCLSVIECDRCNDHAPCMSQLLLVMSCCRFVYFRFVYT